MRDYSQKASREAIERTMSKLKEHGIDALMVSSQAEARERVLEMIPQGAQVMTMTSVTLDAVGLTKELNESGKWDSVRVKLNDPSTSQDEKRGLGAAPQWAVGSVHAATEDGSLMIASNTGSQLPAYAYGAEHVIWVVGTQKIVKDQEEGRERIYTYTLPLESKRAKKAYGVPGSSVNKLLVINQEVQPARATVIFLDEVVGF